MADSAELRIVIEEEGGPQKGGDQSRQRPEEADSRKDDSRKNDRLNDAMREESRGPERRSTITEEAGRKPAITEEAGSPPRANAKIIEESPRTVPTLARSASAGEVGMGEAGAGEVGMGAGGAGAGAAGAAGGVIAVVGAVAQAIGELAQKAGNAAQAAGRFSVTLAGGGRDPAHAILQAGDAAATLAGKIPILGPAFEGVGKGAVKAAGALGEAAEAFIMRGTQLARFSPELAGANAVAQVRTTLGDIREAQALGPGIASITDSFSQITDELREILLPIQKAVVEVIGGILEEIADFMRSAKPLFEAVANGVAELIRWIGDVIVGLMENIIELLRHLPWIGRYIKDNEDKEKEKEAEDFGANWLRKLREQVGADPAIQGANIQPLHEKLNIPAFQGLNMNPQFGMGG